MEIIKLKTGEVIPYENNPRKNDGAVAAVAESIKQCGYCSPIIIDENNVILCGHTRLKALKQLGYKEVECVRREGMTEEQKKKYRLLDNKTAELAEWDFELLEKELQDIDFEDFDFGFSDFLPDEIPLDREKVGTAANIKQLKYGSTVIPLTEEEDEEFDRLLSQYLTDNGTLYGFIGYLTQNN